MGTPERRRFLGLELWQQVVAGLAVALILAIAGVVFRFFSASPPSSTATVNESPTTASAPSTATVAATTTRDSTAAGAGCAITPSEVGRIYTAPDVSGPSTSVPVASYPVIKREAVPFAGASQEWYEIRVQGQLAWIIDEPGQITANSCGPL
jgi:hypothetical protein